MTEQPFYVSPPFARGFENGSRIWRHNDMLICEDKLQLWFDVPEGAKTIWIELYENEVPESVEVTATGLPFVYVGAESRFISLFKRTNAELQNIVRKAELMPRRFYVQLSWA